MSVDLRSPTGPYLYHSTNFFLLDFQPILGTDVPTLCSIPIIMALHVKHLCLHFKPCYCFLHYRHHLQSWRLLLLYRVPVAVLSCWEILFLKLYLSVKHYRQTFYRQLFKCHEKTVSSEQILLEKKVVQLSVHFFLNVSCNEESQMKNSFRVNSTVLVISEGSWLAELLRGRWKHTYTYSHGHSTDVELTSFLYFWTGRMSHFWPYRPAILQINMEWFTNGFDLSYSKMDPSLQVIGTLDLFSVDFSKWCRVSALRVVTGVGVEKGTSDVTVTAFYWLYWISIHFSAHTFTLTTWN